MKLAIDEAVAYLEERLGGQRPRIAVVLGSGLGVFADALEQAVSVPYGDIPHWPQSTAIGHAGTLIVGRLGDLDVLCLAGRAHLYEGYTAQQVTFGTRVLAGLGVHSLVLTNAAGGINLTYEPGELVLISDHLNLQGVNPLTGPNDETMGPRFPDMSEAYSAMYRHVAKQVAAELGIEIAEGVYAGLAGPSYETPAEIRYLRTIGADLVGMSTVPEVIVANHMGLRVLAISCVTNMAAGILPQKIHHGEVLETGARVRDTLVRLLRTLLPRLERAHQKGAAD
jgi:purine-nucleoside phosphorylase